MALINVIQKSQLIESWRFDAEFSQIFVSFNHQYVSLYDLVDRITGSAFYPSIANYYGDRGLPFIRVADLHGIAIDKDTLTRIDDNIINRYKNIVIAKPFDILASKGGSIGYFSIVTRDIGECALSRDIILVNTNEHKISPYYLIVYLLSRCAQQQIQRNVSQQVQPHLTFPALGNIKCFVPNQTMQDIITIRLKQYLSLNNNSNILYNQAHKLLDEAIAWGDKDNYYSNNWNANLQNIIKSQRLDPEFWHPQHDQVVGIKTETLGSIAAYKKGIEVGSNEYCIEGYKFVRVSDITTNGVDGTDTKFISKDLFENLKTQFKPSVGEILLTKDASPGVATLIEEETDCIISSGVLRLLLTEKINPYYLEFVLNSQFVKKQIERYCAGSVIVHWKPSQIEKTNIPRLKEDQENEIAKLVQQSHQLRRESKRLLEVAKKAVEIAIEESEERAMQYLNENQATSIEY